MARGDLEFAGARLELATEYSPRFTEAWVNRGLLALASGHLEQARKHLHHARELNPDLPTPHHGLGLLAERRGLFDEACAHYRVALKVDPGFSGSRINLANLDYRAGRYEEAREHFLKLALHRPKERAGWLGLVETYLRLERSTDADATLSRASAEFPGDPELAILEARRALRAVPPDTKSAREKLDRARHATGPHVARAVAFLSVVALVEGKRDEARALANEARALDASEEVVRYARRINGFAE
jgi:tetratricopeptide (TPR) repeat protein